MFSPRQKSGFALAMHYNEVAMWFMYCSNHIYTEFVFLECNLYDEGHAAVSFGFRYWNFLLLVTYQQSSTSNRLASSALFFKVDIHFGSESAESKYCNSDQLTYYRRKKLNKHLLPQSIQLNFLCRLWFFRNWVIAVHFWFPLCCESFGDDPNTH